MSLEAGFRQANLGLGGNIGDPAAYMAAALRMIAAHADCHVARVSRLYRTPPWGKTDQDWFFNACALIETSLSPEALLDLCLGLEKEMNRVRIERWGPRTLDIDILTYEGVTSDAERLLLPHPRVAERAFVLMPLCDYAPETMIGTQSARDLLAKVDAGGIEPVSKDGGWWKA
ncbi:2-amino-4-hydroxy-6-hydroxymethyldihydropteridinediphosphokinase [Ensifer adhaerens]|nr:2-amino-4-hydroxy-6-hydroxymethyldihydropteridinediphosphokinase [Ensifer adhaerens]